MNYKEPALGIMKMYEYDNSVAYEVKCTCGNEDHTLHTVVEAFDDNVAVTTFVTVNTDYWSEWLKLDIDKLVDNYFLYSAAYSLLGFINYIARNLKLTYHIWVKGCVKFENSTIMTLEQANNYADTLKHAVETLEKK